MKQVFFWKRHSVSVTPYPSKRNYESKRKAGIAENDKLFLVGVFVSFSWQGMSIAEAQEQNSSCCSVFLNNISYIIYIYYPQAVIGYVMHKKSWKAPQQHNSMIQWCGCGVTGVSPHCPIQGGRYLYETKKYSKYYCIIYYHLRNLLSGCLGTDIQWYQLCRKGKRYGNHWSAAVYCNLWNLGNLLLLEIFQKAVWHGGGG